MAALTEGLVKEVVSAPDAYLHDRPEFGYVDLMFARLRATLCGFRSLQKHHGQYTQNYDQ